MPSLSSHTAFISTKRSRLPSGSILSSTPVPTPNKTFPPHTRYASPEARIPTTSTSATARPTLAAPDREGVIVGVAEAPLVDDAALGCDAENVEPADELFVVVVVVGTAAFPVTVDDELAGTGTVVALDAAEAYPTSA